MFRGRRKVRSTWVSAQTNEAELPANFTTGNPRVGSRKPGTKPDARGGCGPGDLARAIWIFAWLLLACVRQTGNSGSRHTAAAHRKFASTTTVTTFTILPFRSHESAVCRRCVKSGVIFPAGVVRLCQLRFCVCAFAIAAIISAPPEAPKHIDSGGGGDDATAEVSTSLPRLTAASAVDAPPSGAPRLTLPSGLRGAAFGDATGHAPRLSPPPPPPPL